MEEFDVLYNQRVITEERLDDASQTQAKKVLNPQPKPIVNEFNEVSGDTRAVHHLGPGTVVNDELLSIYSKGKYIPSLENTEEVFMQENFDNRDYFDSALPVEHQIMEEMASPVVETQLNNSEIEKEDLPEGKEAVGPLAKLKKDKMMQYGLMAAVAYLILRK